MALIDGPRLPPSAGGAARQLVILAHGYGSNGDDLIGLAPHWARQLPHAAFVSPNAPEPVPGYPGGRQWFPLTRLDPAELANGVRRAAPALEAFVAAELARHALPASACALVGFSQGTMMSLAVGLAPRPEPLAAVVGFSGALVSPPAQGVGAPVLLIHGDADEVVPLDALLAAFTMLGAAGGRARFSIRPNLGHSIDEAGLALGGAFLADAFAGHFSGWSPPERLPASA